MTRETQSSRNKRMVAFLSTYSKKDLIRFSTCGHRSVIAQNFIKLLRREIGYSNTTVDIDILHSANRTAERAGLT